MNHFAFKLPLRAVLVVPFILQVFGAVALTGWLSLRNGQQAVNEVSGQLRNEVRERIQQHLQSYLAIPPLINQLNVNELQDSQVDQARLKSLERGFWQKMQSFEAVTYIYFGTSQGQTVGVERSEANTLQIRAGDQASGGKYYTYAADAAGNRGSIVKVRSNYDPRKRPWYRTALQAGKPIWTEVYPFFSRSALGITAAQPLYDNKQVVQGVMAVDLTLSQVSEFLHGLKFSRSGQTFIMDRSGSLVASSTQETPFTLQQDQPTRMQAKSSRNPLIQAAAEDLTTRFSDLRQIDQNQSLEFMENGKRIFVQVSPIRDERGLDWLIVVVLPEEDFMERIEANTRMTIILCLIALVVASLVGIATSQWVIQPILQLSTAAEALSRGEWNNRVDLDREDEVGTLARAFNHMASQLQESFIALEAKNAELEHLNQLKDEFLANTSHELRTPLNGIIGIAESLMDGATGPLSEKTNANLAMVASSGRRLSSLINDILDFSKLQHKTITLQLRPVGLKELTDVVLTLSQPLVGKKPIQLVNAIGSDIPWVEADENRVQQILYNLIGNAIKFTESGQIQVQAKSIGRLLEVSVADTGIGISSDKLERIFAAFEQADGSTARVYGGTGLGLAITRQLVELHGGHIRVASIVGQGSTFTFTLPVVHETVPIAPATPQPQHLLTPLQATAVSPPELDEVPLMTAEAFQSVNKEFKILIVDDEPVNLQVLKNNLVLQNYSITQASSGQEALDIIQNGFKPDLMLLDIMMPKMTGYEVCQKLRETFLPSELPIVMLTAKNQTADLVEGFSSGANDYLTKPFSKSELLARIKTHINLAKINSVYSRFVPDKFIRFLGHESIVDVKLGDQIQKVMTILFSDIRSFTTLSEVMTPEENFKFINEYLSQVTPIIHGHRGFIDKYIGDAVMALFPESADDAVQGAIGMQHQVTRYNDLRRQQGQPPIAIGIGLHTGILMLGIIGEAQRMESTVISDAVNLASRLEGLTKLYSVGILISEQTLQQLDRPADYKYRYLDRVILKGKTAPVSVYEVYDADAPAIIALKDQTADLFAEGLKQYYQQNFTIAQQHFHEVLRVNPQDEGARLYVRRCETYLRTGIPEGWIGVEAMAEK
ncbi:guanylate cyclase [Leptolyngbya sp. 'hensonii']|uniref:response regulator n=1 Tax=Leptolyngbya sp. 'hensonii' TaxID=1922337 RepID=UPI00094F967D|nr:response regulator [Leptolyngbya sp. 'hensonii']OLP17250.1 guanylate cyclase [Leptolyngbya sp. 'hensonii']